MNLNNNLFFFKINIVFFTQDTFLYTYKINYLKFKKILMSYSIHINDLMFGTVAEKLSNYIDDLDKFDFHSRKYRLYRKFKSSKNIFNNNIVSRSIYNNVDNGLLKIVKSWSHYLKGRYGVGIGIIKLLTKYDGTLSSNLLSLNLLNLYLYQFNFKWFFLKNINYFDYKKAILSFYSFSKHKYRFTFKGWCYVNHYPVNGQKRRTNYKTTRLYNQFMILKIKK